MPIDRAHRRLIGHWLQTMTDSACETSSSAIGYGLLSMLLVKLHYWPQSTLIR
ncbi:MAG TPA: hypothetical protein VEI53_12115 [Ktedonobacteraceae bacterium]|nr:hypothetical protein [Ktedonobacteraceae bacterium]